MSVYSF